MWSKCRRAVPEPAESFAIFLSERDPLTGKLQRHVERLLRKTDRPQTKYRAIGEPCQRQYARRITGLAKRVVFRHAATIEQDFAEMALL